MSLPKKIVYVSLYVLGLCLFQEVIFRICFPLPELSNFNRSAYIPVPTGSDPPPPMRFEARSYQSFPDNRHQYVHHLNGYGFRGAAWPLAKLKGKHRVMMVGDSFMEGAMAEDEETIAVSFGEKMGAGYEVLNAGIIGAGLPEYALLIHDAVPAFQPDVLLLVLFSNDISNRPANVPTHPFVPAPYHWYVPRIITVISELTQGKPAPFRWKAARSFIPPVPDPVNLWTTREAEFTPHVTAELAAYMKAGNYNTWRINYAAAEEKHLKETVDMTPYFQWLQQFAQQHGVQLGVVYIPSRQQVTTYYYPFEKLTCQQLCPDSMDLTAPEYQIHRKALDTLCQKMDIPFHDLTEAIYFHESNQDHLYWNYDDHMKGQSYQMIGALLADWWEQEEKE